MAQKTLDCIFNADEIWIASERSVVAGETLRSLNDSQITPGAVVGFGYWDETANKIIPGYPPAVIAQSDVDKHTTAVISRINPIWTYKLTSPTDGSRNTGSNTPSRWLNLFYWIGGAHESCKALIADSTISNAITTLALAAYKSLVPADVEKLTFWYLNHSDSVWSAYRPSNKGYFLFDTTTTTLPEFGSDAQSSLLWNGQNNTLDTTVNASWSGI